MTKIKRFAVGYLQTNCYVITSAGQKEAAIIDPGGGYADIRAYLAGEGKTPSAILLTHGHFDHILDARKFQLDGAKVFIHPDDADLLQSGGLARQMGVRMTPISADEFFSDGEQIKVGEMTFTILHTPGHSRGSCCLIFEDNIFSGDTLFEESYGRTDFQGGSMQQLQASLSSLFALECDYKVLPGHMGDTTLSHERQYNPILR